MQLNVQQQGFHGWKLIHLAAFVQEEGDGVLCRAQPPLKASQRCLHH